MPLNQYFTLAITANDDSFKPPSWQVYCLRSELKAEVRRIEKESDVTVNAVFDESGHKVRETNWR